MCGTIPESATRLFEPKGIHTSHLTPKNAPTDEHTGQVTEMAIFATFKNTFGSDEP